MTTTFIDEIALTRLLHDTLGWSRNLVNYRFLREATDYAVVAATLTNPAQQVVIKLAGPQAVLAPNFERSAMIAQIVRSRSAVPTFEVLAVDVSAQRWPWHYLITTWCSGQLWSEASFRKKNGEARALYTSLGAAIGQMHSIRFSTCGEIASDGRILAGTNFADALRTRAQRRIANPAHVALFLSVLQEHRSLFEALPDGVLCHEDLNPGNLLVQEVPASPPVLQVLDFDSAWAGCAESDLARLEFWRGMVGEGFWEAYRTIAPLSDSYSQRRPIFQLLWCLEYARSTLQHLRDTASVCEALGLPPVTFP